MYCRPAGAAKSTTRAKRTPIDTVVAARRFPLGAPLPMDMAIIDGLRGLLTKGDDINSAADDLRQGFAQARTDYKANGPSYGLSASDTRTAWLFAKSNQYSVQLHGDKLAKL
jgi:hypothetical protein